MISRFILSLLVYSSFTFSITSQAGQDILEWVRGNPRIIPQTKIEGAVITITDGSQVTMKIECESLVIVDANQNRSTPTILKGNVKAIFYDENQKKVSVLESDFAEYVENYSLIAKNNIIVYNLETKDTLVFINESSEIEWNHFVEKIQSYDQFILKNEEGCTTGSSFQSNVDLTDMNISNPRGSNKCE